MGEPNPRLDRFFARERPWQDEVRALRSIMLACPVTEDLRWRQPCYRAHDGNIAIIGGMKDSAFVSFLKGALLADPAGILVAPGEHSRSARFAKFTSLAEIEARAGTIRAYVGEAVQNEKEGRKVDFAKDDLAVPPQLQAAFDDDPALSRAFQALTPGRRRSWLLHFGQAKQPGTVVARIERAASKIMAGKGMTDR